MAIREFIINAIIADDFDKLTSLLSIETYEKLREQIYGDDELFSDTLLHIAFKYRCSKKIINFLIDVDKELIYAVDKHENTPLYYALKYYHPEETIVLLVKNMIMWDIVAFEDIEIKGERIMKFLKYYVAYESYREIENYIRDVKELLSYDFDHDRCAYRCEYCDQRVCYCEPKDSSLDEYQYMGDPFFDKRCK